MSDPRATAEEELDVLLREGKISPEDYDTLRQALAKGAAPAPQPRPAAERRLAKSRSRRQLGGVSAGIADYFGIDVWAVRAGFLLALLFTGGTALLVYFVLYLVLPWSEASPDTLDNTRTGSTRGFALSLAALWVFGILFNLYLLPKFVAIFAQLGKPLGWTMLHLLTVRQALWGSYPALVLQIVLLALIYTVYRMAPPAGAVRRALPRLLAVIVVAYVVLWAWGILSNIYPMAQRVV